MDNASEQNLLDFSQSDRLSHQIEHRFLRALAQRVEEELFPGNYQDYLEHFYQSGYHKIINRRAEQLAEELKGMYEKNTGDSADPALYLLLQREFDGLLDQFIILHCRALHRFHLPQAILRYSNRSADEADLREMIFDYLGFGQEPEKVFTDLSRMPAAALQKAMKSFLLPGAKEQIYFICDQSLLGSCQEGFAMTDQTLYWKAHLHPARQIFYTDLQAIVRDNGDWITINGRYFNVSPLMNLKMFKLLRKLREWFGVD